VSVSGFIWFSTMSSGEFLLTRYWVFWFHKSRGISWPS